MVRHKKILDTSNELLVHRYGNGIKLVRPDEIIEKNKLFAQSSHQTVADLMQMPMGVYFDNPEIIIQNINDLNAEACGFNSVEDAVGKGLFDVFKKDTATYIVNNDKEVIETNQMQIIEEEYLRKDDNSIQSLSIKFPWYGSNNEIIGLLGFSIMLGRQSLAESLLHLTKLGLLNSPAGYDDCHFLPGSKINNVYLSRRETQCLQLYIKGKTAKEVARILRLSYRTVENYIRNIKIKMGVTKKSELIIKMMDHYNRDYI